ncbi:PD40 domain-containing protein [Catenulispora rubra]|uniref:PD40 domain-containing protein n=1 Tax=Catenulispora rubra TaxID=280293 RepID=UPI0018924250|nr:PD40 domain-containing protein [Catenulispora rubra]
MAGQGSKMWARAAMCAAALVTPLVVSGCQSATNATGTGGAAAPQAGGSSTPSAVVSTSASAGASGGTPTSAPSQLNATTGNGITVSDGGSKILMNGKAVDFGTQVHDPSWSPDGTRVVFIDGSGSLVVANADGSGRTEAAHNPGGQTWSHPTWQTTQADTADGMPARNNIFFASSVGGTTLWEVPTTAHDAQPTQLTLNGYSGEGSTPPPAKGNTWPAGGGKFGGAVYEHDSATSSDVYVRDNYLRQQGGLAIKNAAEPDYVLVGTSSTSEGAPEVVFVRQVGAHKHVFVESIQTSTGGAPSAARDLTPNATTDCTEPAISPDGKTVVFSTSSGVVTVAADGSGTPAFVTNTPGFPAFRPGS